MARKSAPKPDDPEQSKRFIEAAKEVGADDEKALDRAFKKVATQPKQQPSPKK
jgi:hypothetical protein